MYHIPHTNQPAPYYAAADIFLLPSAGGGFPLSALEAAASGLPLVLGLSPVTQELFGDARAGLLVGQPVRTSWRVEPGEGFIGLSHVSFLCCSGRDVNLGGQGLQRCSPHIPRGVE